MQRRTMLKAVLACCVLPRSVWGRERNNAGETITVYKSETCGCCAHWVSHLRESGFDVKTHNVPNTAAYRARLGMPVALGSCHTATIGDYVLEGHVPAQEIRRLLTEKPRAIGLAVPGMPAGSPGMENASGRAEAYDVLLLRADGSQEIYRRYAAR